MKIKLGDNGKIFLDLLGIMTKITDEAKLTFTPEGLNLFGTQGGTTAVQQTYSADFFEEYEIVGELEEFGIMLNDIVKPTKKLKGTFTLESVENKLVLSGGKDKYSLPIIEDVATDFSALPDITNDFNITLTFTQLSEAIDKTDIVGRDAVTFLTEEGKFKIRCKGDTREFVTEVCDSENELEGEPLFGRSLIQALLIKSNDTVTLKLSNNNPLMLNYEKNGAVMNAMIAPRIDNN